MSDQRLRGRPIREAVTTGAVCGLFISAFVSLLLGRGLFVWNSEVAVIGLFAAAVGAARGWKAAKDSQIGANAGPASAEASVALANAPSGTIVREELQEKLARAAQFKSLLTMLSMFVTFPVSFGAFVLLVRLGIPPIFGFPIILVLLFGPPFIVDRKLAESYCKPAVTCPHCGHSLWECGTGNLKPRRMKVRPDPKACPNCGVPIV